MTREEIIREIDFVDFAIQSRFNDCSEMTHRALQEAIKLIKQEASEDCISRKYILDKIHSENDMDKIENSNLFAIHYANLVKNAPSVTPATRWIPVSERLPEEMGTYMTTIDYGEHGLVPGQRYYYGRGLKWNDECVIAWQPLPKHYVEEKE